MVSSAPATSLSSAGISPSNRFITKNPNRYAPRRNQNVPIQSITFARRSSSNGQRFTVCRATGTNSYDSLMSSMVDFDLYDLLGVERDSNHSRIKTAYRLLQKRCHPDIAGPTGHDMAIILNEAYALLSDPASRADYDKELTKMSEIKGYNGKPLYSVWLGSDSEERAVFVDEVKCVGCLKCALFASNTFAIESVYGRARVVAQWADPEPTIQEAIDTCPVDCISMVDRRDLPALEFLMSKQPRGNVRIGVSNTVGARATDVFNEVELLKKRFNEAEKKKNLSSEQYKESDQQRDRRISAARAIMAVTNWLTQQQPSPRAESYLQYLNQDKVKSPTDPTIKKLEAIAAKRRQAMAQGGSTRLITSSNTSSQDEYWVPTNYILSPVTHDRTSTEATTDNKTVPPTKNPKQSNEKLRRYRERPAVWWGAPLGSAIIGAVFAGLQQQDGSQVGSVRLEEHVAGPLALGIVNSFWSHIFLAGLAWYAVGSVVALAVELIVGRRRN